VKLSIPFALVALVVSAVPARAELAYFHSGQTLSIKEHRLDGESLVLKLRNGGPDHLRGVGHRPVCAGRGAVSGARTGAEAGRGCPGPPVVPYGELIDKVAADQGVPVKLVRAVIQVESAYQPRARSPKGAMGLMQLMPTTARQYGVANPYDPMANIEAGIKHLKSLTERLPLALALAAYNAGEAAVARFHGIPPYPRDPGVRRPHPQTDRPVEAEGGPSLSRRVAV
jgi:hypothetical protein